MTTAILTSIQCLCACVYFGRTFAQGGNKHAQDVCAHALAFEAILNERGLTARHGISLSEETLAGTAASDVVATAPHALPRTATDNVFVQLGRVREQMYLAQPHNPVSTSLPSLVARSLIQCRTEKLCAAIAMADAWVMGASEKGITIDAGAYDCVESSLRAGMDTRVGIEE